MIHLGNGRDATLGEETFDPLPGSSRGTYSKWRSWECQAVKCATVGWVNWHYYMIGGRGTRDIEPVRRDANTRSIGLCLQARSRRWPGKLQLVSRHAGREWHRRELVNDATIPVGRRISRQGIDLAVGVL